MATACFFLEPRKGARKWALKGRGIFLGSQKYGDVATGNVFMRLQEAQWRLLRWAEAIGNGVDTISMAFVHFRAQTKQETLEMSQDGLQVDGVIWRVTSTANV
ncbi:hypothetical protein AMTR_s00085p00167560 [Amborella trichopoda]|uniref:Uncharacterized protein n=1 Tax=Amborella trichopoda TaxID=13333 RepID=W1NYR2_AMBTC|nr:hypothetical protein AMTR_s00085p00167560 [Amborella trichopoda]